MAGGRGSSAQHLMTVFAFAVQQASFDVFWSKRQALHLIGLTGGLPMPEISINAPEAAQSASRMLLGTTAVRGEELADPLSTAQCCVNGTYCCFASE